MSGARLHLGWLTVLAAACWAPVANVYAQQPPLYPASPYVVPLDAVESHSITPMRRGSTPARVSLEQIAPEIREAVRQVVQQPTISAAGPIEEFSATPAVYRWLLDHPDRAAKGWKKLGAPCLDIVSPRENLYSWTDTQGNDLAWETVCRGPNVQIWYAHGRTRPPMLLPAVPVRAVVVLHHCEVVDSFGRPRIQQQADMFVQTDSKTAQLVLRLLGPSVPRISEQCLGQLCIFFSAMAHYIDRHPDRAEVLLSDGAQH